MKGLVRAMQIRVDIFEIDYLIFLNIVVWKTITAFGFCLCSGIQNNFVRFSRLTNFADYLKTCANDWLVLLDTVCKVKEFGELSNEDIKTVGHRISFPDNLQKLRFGGRFCGHCVLSWKLIWRHKCSVLPTGACARQVVTNTSAIKPLS